MTTALPSSSLRRPPRGRSAARSLLAAVLWSVAATAGATPATGDTAGSGEGADSVPSTQRRSEPAANDATADHATVDDATADHATADGATQASGVAGWARCDGDRDRPALPVALTIRGGASMGVWEAGATWALLRAARAAGYGDLEGACTIDIRAMTGTSAGSVNAALGAAEWLLERPGSVWNNALLAGWIDLDIEAMVPELIGRSGRREPDDAVTLRAALAPTVRVFLETVAHGRTRHGQVDVGVAVTRLDPPSRTRDGLTTRAAREIVLVRMTADEDGAGIRLDQRPVPGAGRRLLLPTTTGGEVAPTALVDAIHASTAFPFVFGAVALEGALRDRPCGSLDDCLEGELERAWYVDGGVFDPAPIHSAVALLEGGDRHEPASGVPPAGRGDMHYVFVDPARTRRDWPTPGQTRDLAPLSEAQRPGAMTSLLLVVSSMRAATSDTELEALLRHHRFSSPSGRATEHGRQLHVLSRGFPTVGVQAFWFAGLFDRTFRVFDYLVGVYDGLVFAAASQCSGGDADSEHADSEHADSERADGEHDGREHQGGALEPLVTETSACEVRALRRLHDVVGLGVDDPATRLASWLVRSLAAWEYGPVCDEVAGRWCQPDRAPDHAVTALFEALRPRDADASSGQPAPTRGLVARLMAEDGTSTLMARYREALAARGLSIEDGAEGPFGRAFIEDPEQAFRLLVSVMANVAVQRDAASDIDRT